MPTESTPVPPEHLSPEAAEWWKKVVAEFPFGSADLEILNQAAATLDRIAEARDAIDRDGSFIEDRYGKPKAHPALGAENQAKVTFARLVRELALPVDVADDRPPRRPGR